MRQGQQHRRGRTRNGQGGGNNQSHHNNNQNRKGQNPISRSYQSHGPDGKVSGTASLIAEKYLSMARDATTSGDPVLAENYLQHAEHYNRIILAYRESQAPQGDGPRHVAAYDDADQGDDDGETYGRDMQPLPPMETVQPRVEPPRALEPRNDQRGERGDQRADAPREGTREPGRDGHQRMEDRPPRFNDQQRRNQPRERYQPERFNGGNGGGNDRPQFDRSNPNGDRQDRGAQGAPNGERAGNERPFADRNQDRNQDRGQDRYDRGPERSTGPNSDRQASFDRGAQRTNDRGGERFQPDRSNDRPYERLSDRPAFIDRPRAEPAGERQTDRPAREPVPARFEPRQPDLRTGDARQPELRQPDDAARGFIPREMSSPAAPPAPAPAPMPTSAAADVRPDARPPALHRPEARQPSIDGAPPAVRIPAREPEGLVVPTRSDLPLMEARGVTMPVEPAASLRDASPAAPRAETPVRAPRMPRRVAPPTLDEADQPDFLKRPVRRPRREASSLDETAAPPAPPSEPSSGSDQT